MRVAIMQPYFLPYIGYFQLIAAVDMFVVYDNIKYTKKGWINRNRMLRNGRDVVFSLPLKSDSDLLDIRERELAAGFNRDKLLNQFKEAYRRAPFFAQVFPLIECIVRYEEKNLFRYLQNSIVCICQYLGVHTEIRISSDFAVDHTLKSQDRVLALCEAASADTYINAAGGMELYSKDVFRGRGIDLKFIRTKSFSYDQFEGAFVPWLSIVDGMMFNSADVLRKLVNLERELV